MTRQVAAKSGEHQALRVSMYANTVSRQDDGAQGINVHHVLHQLSAAFNESGEFKTAQHVRRQARVAHLRSVKSKYLWYTDARVEASPVTARRFERERRQERPR